MRGPPGPPRPGNRGGIRCHLRQARHRKSIQKSIPFFFDLGPIIMPKWSPNRPQNRPQDDQKTILKQTPQKHKKITPTWTPQTIKIQAKPAGFNDFCNVIFAMSPIPNMMPNMAPKWCPNGPQNRSKIDPKTNAKFERILASIFDRFLSVLAPKTGPKS